MEYPTKLYPAPPKPEWYMRAVTNVSRGEINLAGASTAGGEAAGASFQKMTEGQYEEYLKSHQSWLNKVEAIKLAEHQKALQRRYLESYREVPVELTNKNPKYYKSTLPGYVQETNPADPTKKKDVAPAIWFKLEKKVAHEPQKSKKPGHVAKAVARAELDKAREAAITVGLKAKAAVLAKDTVPTVSARLEKVKEVTDLKPLRKAEEAAAKSAAVRSKAIRFGSVDVVPNIDPQGWKVVTRKKGGNQSTVHSVTHQTFKDGHESGRETVFTTVDPSLRVPRSVGVANFQNPKVVK